MDTLTKKDIQRNIKNLNLSRNELKVLASVSESQLESLKRFSKDLVTGTDREKWCKIIAQGINSESSNFVDSYYQDVFDLATYIKYLSGEDLKKNAKKEDAIEYAKTLRAIWKA